MSRLNKVWGGDKDGQYERLYKYHLTNNTPNQSLNQKHMKNQKKWTAEDIALLEKNLLTYPNKSIAFRKTAEKTGRSKKAVEQHYYNSNKSTDNISPTTPKKKKLVVTYHNGTTRNAEVIIHRKDIIVAKMDDVVITLQF